MLVQIRVFREDLGNDNKMTIYSVIFLPPHENELVPLSFGLDGVQKILAQSRITPATVKYLTNFDKKAQSELKFSKIDPDVISPVLSGNQAFSKTLQSAVFILAEIKDIVADKYFYHFLLSDPLSIPT